MENLIHDLQMVNNKVDSIAMVFNDYVEYKKEEDDFIEYLKKRKEEKDDKQRGNDENIKPK